MPVRIIIPLLLEARVLFQRLRVLPRRHRRPDLRARPSVSQIFRPGAGDRRRPYALAAVFVVAIGVGAVIGLAGGGSKSTTRPPRPPRRSRDLGPAGRLAGPLRLGQRGLDYSHPVKVVFLSAAAFKKRVTADDSKLTAKDRPVTAEHTRRAAARWAWSQGKVDLFAQGEPTQGASTEAYYDDEKKEIVIPGSTLDVEQRVTLAREPRAPSTTSTSTSTRVNKIGDQHDTDAVTALIEGDAVWVEDQYERRSRRPIAARTTFASRPRWAPTTEGCRRSSRCSRRMALRLRAALRRHPARGRRASARRSGVQVAADRRGAGASTRSPISTATRPARSPHPRSPTARRSSTAARSSGRCSGSSCSRNASIPTSP